VSVTIRPEELPFPPSPEQRCREGWTCYVCAATAGMLKPEPRGGPHQVYCRSCGMRYDLSLPADGQKTRYSPKPHLNAEGARVWKRAWLHFESATKTRRFMQQFDSPSLANNAMNRLDGGIIPDGR